MDFKWGARVFCNVISHDLGKRFPDEPYWEYCCECEATWVAEPESSHPSRAICPGCSRKLDTYYLCHRCETFGLNQFKTATGINACGVCSAPLRDVRWHYCVTLNKSFYSARDECPFCNALFFPTLPSVFLSSKEAAKFRLARINRKMGEELSLVEATSNNSSEALFFVIEGSRGAIALPRYTTRSGIEQRTRQYQQAFDWPSDWTEEISIARPAILEIARNGWTLKEHGQLVSAVPNDTEIQAIQSDSETSLPTDSPISKSCASDIVSTESSVQFEETNRDGSTASANSKSTSNEAKSSRSDPRSIYRSLIAGGSSETKFAYVDWKKSAPKTGGSREYFKKSTSSVGAFVLIEGSDNRGWLFPNPERDFNEDSLTRLFPNLTADQFNNSEGVIEPVPVVRIGNDRWELSREPNAPNQSTVATLSQELRQASTTKPATTFPNLESKPIEPKPIEPASPPVPVNNDAETSELGKVPEYAPLSRSSATEVQSSRLRWIVFGAAGVLILGVTLASVLLPSNNKNNMNRASASPAPAQETTPAGMVLVTGGEFVMGSDLKNAEPDEKPAHKVTMRPFYMDATEVTCERLSEICAGNRP